jgi:hypothetical protein
MKTSTPKCLSDLQYEDMQIAITDDDVKGAAEEWFINNMPGPIRPIFVRHLFTENDGSGYVACVYAAYEDAGSDDYLYIIVK